jgi:DNA-binding CsgD family transcriptional regulator
MVLAERDVQNAHLMRTFSDCLRGRPGIVWLEGPVGTGRSELLASFLARAAKAGAAVLHGAGMAPEQQMPLGVLRQMFRDAPLPPEAASMVARTLEDGAFAAYVSSIESDQGRSVSPQVLQRLDDVILGLTTQRPVVICIDDVQDADAASLQFLLHLVRWARAARLLVVVAERQGPEPAHMAFRVEMQRQPRCHCLRTAPLSPAGVEQVLRDRLPGAAGDVGACVEATGGNPLLVHGWTEDRRHAGDPGEYYGSAMLSCLYRCQPAVQQVLQAMVVLGEFAEAGAVARFIEAEPDYVVRIFRGLQAAGLLDGERFRHPAAAAAVCRAISRESLPGLHARAARLLYGDGADAVSVASHLDASGTCVDAPWAAAVLQQAAEVASHDGELERAVAYLKLAYRTTDDVAERMSIRATLAYVGWRVNPSVAARNLPELVTAARNGTLRGPAVFVPIWHSMWFGRVEDATTLIEKLIAEGPAEPETAAEIWRASRWLTTWYPAMAHRLPTAASAVRAKAVPPPVADPHPHAEAMLALGKVLERHEDDVINAVRALRAPGVDDRTLNSLVSSLTALVSFGRLEQAAVGCDDLLGRLAGCNATTWQALLTAIRAEISYRMGDLRAAERHASTALWIMPPESWGITVGAPRATAINTAVAIGDYEAAADHLNQPVPAAMFHTPYGVNYLIARGRYRVATGACRSAIEDFGACGEMLGSWGLDLAVVAPWRTDAGWAYLRLGETRRARELASEQLARAGGHSYVRGNALRLLAATCKLIQRPPLLCEAIEQLQDARDRLGLAHAIAELSRAQQDLGRSSQARVLLRRASTVARECNAEQLYRSLHPGAGEFEPFGPQADSERVAALSDAERKVAALAARGHTNRQIARKLCITLSTVEQHLTRIYRKLGVSRRSDLLPLVQREVLGTA